ncbi:MAG: hypothetical protein N3D19_04670 [Archaeoglobaceae archaeon]|nr:hypothetical protein [Archaeoglobaceae archaeon]
MIFLVSPTLASNIFLDGEYLIAEVLTENGLGAFEVEVAFDSSKVSIYDVSLIPPFIGDYNINSFVGIIKIVGFCTEVPGPKGIVKIAKIETNNGVRVSSAVLYDVYGDILFYYKSGDDGVETSPSSDERFIESGSEKSSNTQTHVEVPMPEITVTISPRVQKDDKDADQNYQPPVESTIPEITKEINEKNTSVLEVINKSIEEAKIMPEKKLLPGFEFFYVVLAILFIIFIFRRKRKN